MSANKKPVAVKVIRKEIENKPTLYYTIGTQQVDADGNYFIDSAVVKKAFDKSTPYSYAERGLIVILEDEVLEDYLKDGFSYIDSNNASSNTMRKLKEAEASKADLERKYAELEAKMSKASTVKTVAPTLKGGTNA